jgi:predicted nucleic acid-binding protein
VTLVIDSSITLSWYFDDEWTPESQAVLDDIGDNGAIVPALWHFEVANGLQVAVRRKRIDAAYRDSTLMDLEELDIAVDTESIDYVWSATVKLAERHALTVYDAAYLELAQRRRLSLATLDTALIRAANTELVTVLGVA